MLAAWIVVASVLVGLPLVSYAVEWLRRAPVAPQRVAWAPDIPVGYATVGGLRLRYLVGESIGGSIALILAARHHAAVRRVVAVNPYDYDGGRGIRRSSAIANVLFGLNDVPIFGATFTRLRQYAIVRRVFEGGVYRPGSLPDALTREMYEVGNRPGHYRAFMSLAHQWAGWERARAEYTSIERPVLLVYGDHDWSRVPEREADRQAIPGAVLLTVKGAGHFLALDAPDELVRAVRDFTAGGA